MEAAEPDGITDELESRQDGQGSAQRLPDLPARAGFPYTQTERKAMDHSPEERQAILEQLWEDGGFKFMWSSFTDLMTDEAANRSPVDFVRSKIREVVKDPDVAERLCVRRSSR